MTITADEALARYPRAVLSHESAARKLGIDLLEDDAAQAVTVPRSMSRVQLAGWVVHRTDLDAVDLRAAQKCTSAVRTVVDLARTLALAKAVAAADSAMRKRLVTRRELEARLSAAWGRGAAPCRVVGRLLDDRCESVLESALRVLYLTSELPPPRTQYAIPRSSPAIRVDFCWPSQRLVVEADGFAFHSERADYRRDRARMNDLERLGWRVLRFTFEDVLSRPDHVLTLTRHCLLHAAA